MTAMLEQTRTTVYPRQDWGWDAVCRTMDVAIFYGSSKVPLTGKAAAPGRAICAACPVARDCLIEALLMRDFIGLRAGFLGHERRSTLMRVGWSVPAAVAEFDQGTFFTRSRP